MAKYSDIKGFTVQTVTSDPAVSQASTATWASSTAINTARQSGGNAGTATSAIFMSGTPTPAAVETWNGSSWTEVAELNTARITGGSTGFTGTAAIYAGGEASGPTANVETWDGSSFTETTDTPVGTRSANMFGSSTASVLTGGATGSPGATSSTSLLWNGSSWTSITEMGTDRNVGAEAGISTLGIIATGGYDPGQTISNVEQWNGSAWTEVSDVNTARAYGISSIAAGYNSYIICSGAPIDASPLKANTEFWDGSSWTELADLASAARSSGGSGGSSASALIFGGLNPSVTTDSFEWSGTPSATFQKQVEGQLYFNSTTNTFKETITDIAGATWSSGGSTNTAREFAGRAGSQTAGLTFGGAGTPSALAITELYNGSSWTEVADLNTARGYLLLGNGPSTSALCSGGDVNPPAGAISVNAINESWNGSSWTEVGDLNTARTLTGQFGASNTSSVVAGGYNNTANVSNNESWDGSSWTEIAEQNTARRSLAAMGIATAGILASGNGPTADVELWDGTSWTETTNVNTARTNLSGSGTQTSSIVYGGRTAGFEDKTEFWNGTSWTELNNLSTGRSGLGGSPAGTSSSALAYLGQTPSATTATEEWTADLSNKTITAS